LCAPVKSIFWAFRRGNHSILRGTGAKSTLLDFPLQTRPVFVYWLHAVESGCQCGLRLNNTMMVSDLLLGPHYKVTQQQRCSFVRGKRSFVLLLFLFFVTIVLFAMQGARQCGARNCE
jgi:cbb3-type cytochrome oxidase subunit 3